MVKFPLYPLALQWCKGTGIEIGRAQHNPYFPDDVLAHIPNVSCPDIHDFQFYAESQVKMCGSFAHVDIFAWADKIPLPDASQDFVLNSHVIEHLPDPIGALHEWHRLLRPSGIVFLVVPQPDALEADRGRELTTVQHLIGDHQRRETVETHPIPPGHSTKGSHYHVWNCSTFRNFIQKVLPDHFRVVEQEDPDTKVANGFTVVLQKR